MRCDGRRKKIGTCCIYPPYHRHKVVFVSDGCDLAHSESFVNSETENKYLHWVVNILDTMHSQMSWIFLNRKAGIHVISR